MSSSAFQTTSSRSNSIEVTVGYDILPCAINGEKLEARPPNHAMFGAAVMGVPFGIALQKAGLWNPRVVEAVMLLENFILLKVFLSAVAAALMALTVISLFPATRPYFELARNSVCPCDLSKEPAKKGLPLVFFGSFIFGAGMTISGSCPGIVLVQFGSGVAWAGLVLVGALIGAALYVTLDSRLDAARVFGALPWPTVDMMLNVRYALVATPILLFFIAFVAVLEVIFPWREEVDVVAPYKAHYVVLDTSWPPLVCGAIVGLLMLPIVCLLRLRGLGASSSYVTIVASFAKLIAPRKTENVDIIQKATKKEKWWQVAFVVSAALSALVSALTSGTFAKVEGVGPARALIGGMTLLFGARLAGGCTSGHGITGVSHLQFDSILAVCGMFGGGIPTAFAMRALGWL